ncbi:putative 50S ribosomal subunit protein L31 [Candidatus Zinderia insecticola CARI]|uniref:50S ribosomal protein L31 n=1 Tax=Zinderia insecticola (strain CARI) TaxID=871271 RepID=E0TIT5_ZINIC|nr:putative 50S ribosomal subunit protein L31 [Candidatus Zinderia insecticola CARI]
MNNKKIIFFDISSNNKFIINSNIKSKNFIIFKNKKYLLLKIEISSESHPFYTGKKKLIDITGRIDKFNKKFKI